MVPKAAASVTTPRKVAADGTMKIPSPELERQLQKLYVVPRNNEGNGSEKDLPSNPQFISQGDLIKEVISNYAKRLEEEGLQVRQLDHRQEQVQEPPPPPPQQTEQEQQKQQQKEQQKQQGAPIDNNKGTN
mmetsp:Transcript_16027/g.28830  ORF Transcript_16027/g.28830 Transcript_16027/m.28830 type:complete len:131 (-) Transcript_16027:8-400(-)